MTRMLLIAALVLSGCAAGDYIGPQGGYIGDIDTPFGLEINGVPTVLPQDRTAMGYRNNDTAGIEDAFSTITTKDGTWTGMPAIVEACKADEGCISVVLDHAPTSPQP